MKIKSTQPSYKLTIDSDKENCHPNIMRPNQYPKVSSFCPENNSAKKDWQSRVLQPSARERNLEKKLNRLLNNEESPQKVDKVVTEAPSQSRINLGNTLWRYLYERSINTVSVADKQTDLIDELVKITEDVCGDALNLEPLNLNMQETLAAVIDALRDFSERNKIHQQMHP